MTTPLLCAAANPLRPPDWAWYRAQHIHDGLGPPTTRRRDGATGYTWIRKASRYLAAAATFSDQAGYLQLSELYPEIFWALQLRSTVTHQRHAVEAYILSRQDDYDIGFRCGIPERVVHAYEALFFNVRDKLDHVSYILHVVIGDIQRGINPSAFFQLWKLYGYFCGPRMLAAIESRFVSPTWCNGPDDVGGTLADDAIGTLKLQSALAAKSIPVDNATRMSLLEQFTAFVGIERTTDGQGRAQEALQNCILEMLKGLPFATGDETAKIEGDFDTTAAELTYRELLSDAVGRPVAAAPQIRRLSYTDPGSTADPADAQ